MNILVLRSFFLAFLAATLLQVSAWTQNSFEYRQHKSFLDSLRFDSAVSLWSGLDEATRVAYYNHAIGNASAVIKDFESLKAACTENIEEHQKTLDKLADEEKALDTRAKMKSLVVVGQRERDEHSELYEETGPFGATYSRPLYNRELFRHREELYNINDGRQESQNGVKKEQSKIRASAALTADSVEQSANEAEYILALQEAVQSDGKPFTRFHTLEKLESSVVPFDKVVSVIFNGTGRILVGCGGRFKVRLAKEGTGKVTGIGDAIPAYRRFCIVDAKAGDEYSVPVHAEAPISVVIEEVRR